MENVFKTLANIDRRIIYLLMLSIIVGSVIFPIYLPIYINQYTKDMYTGIDEVKSDDIVLLFSGAVPVHYAQMKYGYNVVLWHVLQNKPKIIFAVMEPAGVPTLDIVLNDPVIKNLMDELDYKEGRDYVKVGLVYGDAGFVGFIEDFHGFTRDQYRGTWLDDVENGGDIDVAVDWYGTDSTDRLIQFAYNTYGTEIYTIVVAGVAPRNIPALQAGQLKGQIGGSIGASEYEMLAKSRLNWTPSEGVSEIGTFSLTHLTIIALIILGNIGYFGHERKREITLSKGGKN